MTTPPAAQQPSVTLTPTEVVLAPRPLDLLWDALAALFGPPATPAERAKRNAAVKQFRDGARAGGLAEGEMAAAIQHAHSNWANVMGTATETPHGLAANLSLLLRGPQVTGRDGGQVRGGRPPAVKRGAAALAEIVRREVGQFDSDTGGQWRAGLPGGLGSLPGDDGRADGRLLPDG